MLLALGAYKTGDDAEVHSNERTASTTSELR